MPPSPAVLAPPAVPVPPQCIRSATVKVVFSLPRISLHLEKLQHTVSYSIQVNFNGILAHTTLMVHLYTEERDGGAVIEPCHRGAPPPLSEGSPPGHLIQSLCIGLHQWRESRSYDIRRGKPKLAVERTRVGRRYSIELSPCSWLYQTHPRTSSARHPCTASSLGRTSGAVQSDTYYINTTGE